MAMQSIALRTHGGLRDAELQRLHIAADEIVDFSVNINPYGPPAAVLAAARGAALSRYPDPTAEAARQAMGALIDIPADEIALGNGAVELLWTLAGMLVGSADTALIVEPTFSEFTAAVQSRGGRVVRWQAARARDFAVDLAAVAAAVHGCRPRVVYLCAPNNPTGAGIAMAEICDLAREFAQVVFVVDQAFLQLSEHFAEIAIRPPANAVLVRSLTKEHSIPGLRVGYLVAAADLIAALEAHRPPWSTSAPAQAAAVAALGQGEFIAASRRRLLADRDYLRAALRALGLAPVPSIAPFLLVPVGDGRGLRHRLLVAQQILVRDCASFDLPEYIRLAARPRSDVDRLIAALQSERY